MRTLVVSDLHLGAPSGADVLRDEAPRARLLAALDGIDRLVLLGDTIEGRGGRQRDQLAVALPVLAEIGAAIGGGEVVIVPGNHDHELAARWLEQAPELGLGDVCDPGEASPAAAEIARAMAPARVHVAYPGVWLRDDVWATHGHYLDVHTPVPVLERLVAGVIARMSEPPPSEGATPADYERVLAPIYAFARAAAERSRDGRGAVDEGRSPRLWAMLAAPGPRSLKVRALQTAFPLAVAGVNRLGLGPLDPDITPAGLRRGGLDGIGEVLRRLGVGARHVIFGHTHRTGPLADDAAAEWGVLTNCGSWVRQAHFASIAGPGGAPSPYRPGGSVLLEEDGPPRLQMLLDDLVGA